MQRFERHTIASTTIMNDIPGVGNQRQAGQLHWLRVSSIGSLSRL